MTTTPRKKLIEVALPLEAINKEAAREKSIRHGHPSTLHLWWARRPLAACRAVLFGSLVDDPSSHPDQFPTEEAQDQERQRLFRIIEELVKWENSGNETVLSAARKEILKSTNDHPPPVLDPFCGGGSIPLEAQRLGLKAYASDLNPVAVLITKALIEIPSKFAGKPPVNPESRKKLDHSKAWRGAQGLAEDVRYYGQWMRDEAEKRIGHLYPKVKLAKEYGGGEATVIAWLWARTVKCPNPACGARMPLLRSFQISSKKARAARVEPIVDQRAKTVRFEVKPGLVRDDRALKAGRGAQFKCAVCGQIAGEEHLACPEIARDLGMQLVAIVAEANGDRVFLSPDPSHERAASLAHPDWVPDLPLSTHPQYMGVTHYGLSRHFELYTQRQLSLMATLTSILQKATSLIHRDSTESGRNDAAAYSAAVSTFVGLGVSKLSAFHSTLGVWRVPEAKTGRAFGRQALPMMWDFPENNPFGEAGGEISSTFESIAGMLERLPATSTAEVEQLDAAHFQSVSGCVCTDPPYYDNVPYADLSDYFYVWLRRAVGTLYPRLMSTVLTPKEQELVADHERHGGREGARLFFEKGLAQCFSRLRELHDSSVPMTVFYAFRQAEEAEDDSSEGGQRVLAVSTGWETMLEALLGSSFAVVGTWPMRTEQAMALKVERNALASSIVLVCNPRSLDAPLATRREFVSALKSELPAALKNLQHGNIAPVDLAQAAIGPGMAIFSRYSKVVEADGLAMTVRTALALINQALDEVLAEQESEFDADTRWALAWFEQYAFNEGPFGVAETLSKAKNTSVQGMVEAGIVAARAGKVRLLDRRDLPEDWDPASERRLTVWEVAHYLIKLLEEEGEGAAASLLRQVGALGETARDLAYRLYGICERKKWAQEALPYNSLVVAWPEISRLTRSEKARGEQLPLR
jgi:putative DNA methylase